MKNKFILIALAGIAILIGAFLYNKYRVAPKIKFETLVLTDLDGKPVPSSVFKHQKVFINFFATWCGPCVNELSSLEELETYFSKEDFKLLLISDEPVEKLKAFRNGTGLHPTILHSEKKLKELKVASIPASYLLNSKGEIVFKTTGEENWADPKVIEKLKNLCP